MSLLNDLKRSLVNAKELGNDEWAAALEKRIKAEEKAAAAEAEPEPAPKKTTTAKKGT